MKNDGRDPVGMIGNSAAFLATVKLILRIAQRDATVLVEGETGTGKELAARAIHYSGPRRKGPFVPVNCGAIPESLVESELFGHRQGAFTDAKQAAPGILLLAHGGTVFLDEVDSLSPKAQVTLLRFLQERTIRRVGETLERPVNLRVVAAASRSLEALVERGLFRSDLFYRLNIMYVVIPPLRERGSDIELLAAHFIAQLSRRYGGPSTLDAASIAWLYTQSWPGNVRQLENFLEREYLLGEGLTELRFSVLGEPACEPERECWNYRAAKARVVESFNRRYLGELMRLTRGNVTLAARAAGKERRDFGRLLRKYAIQPQSFRAETSV
jgi:DNA-binding NtrC family response regulator